MHENGLNTDSAVQAGTAEAAFEAFHQLTPDGFMMFRPVRDEAGQITDFQWTFVNDAASTIVGRTPSDLVGKFLLIEMPGNKDQGLFDAYVDVVETGTTWQNEFFYDHGGITAWFRTTATCIADGLAVSFADISEVHQQEERLRNLIDGVLAFVGVMSLDGILLEANAHAVRAAGLDRSEVINIPFWDCFWWSYDPVAQDRLRAAVAAAAKGERVRYDAEIRVAGDQRIWIDFQIAPILDADGNVVELIPSGVDITERKRAESHQELLLKELSHRVKNTLATIQSIAGQSTRTAESLSEFRDAFAARLKSIAGSHDLLISSEHQSVSMAELVVGQIMPYAAVEKRLDASGENLLLPGETAHVLGLILHELATNASKYGAFKSDAGVVRVRWSTEWVDSVHHLKLFWSESGGPEVRKPTKSGFGTRLIERSLASSQDSAAFEYAPEGLKVTLTMVIS